MNINRRGFFAWVSGLLGAGAVKPDVVPAEPRPLFFLVESQEPIPLQDVERFKAEWEALWKGCPPAPLVFAPDGMSLTPIYREEEVQKVFTKDSLPLHHPLPEAAAMAEEIWAKYAADLKRNFPNLAHSAAEFKAKVAENLEKTGTALVWRVPPWNQAALGNLMDVHVLPTADAIPQPALSPFYPHGYYRIRDERIPAEQVDRWGLHSGNIRDLPPLHYPLPEED